MRVFIAEKRYVTVNQVKMNLRLCHSEDPLAGMGGLGSLQTFAVAQRAYWARLLVLKRLVRAGVLSASVAPM